MLFQAKQEEQQDAQTGQREPGMIGALSVPSPKAANKADFQEQSHSCSTQMFAHKPNTHRGHDPENKSTY